MGTTASFDIITELEPLSHIQSMRARLSGRLFQAIA